MRGIAGVLLLDVFENELHASKALLWMKGFNVDITLLTARRVFLAPVLFNEVNGHDEGGVGDDEQAEPCPEAENAVDTGRFDVKDVKL